MAKSQYLIDQTLANLEGSYIGLFAGDPETTAELDKEGYDRQPTGFPAQPSNPALLPQDVELGPAHEDWGEISYLGVFDAETGGNLLYHDPIYMLDPVTGDPIGPGDPRYEPIVVTTGQMLKLPQGTGLSIEES